MKQINHWLSGACLVLFFLGFFYAQSAWGNQAVVAEVQGEVFVKKPGDSDFKKLSPGEQLPQGSIVTTSAASVCRIQLGDNEKSALRLKENSRALISSLDPVKINLETGKLFTLVRGLKKGSGFQVQTPTAIAAARGCGWSQTRNHVGVYEDSVDVQGSGGQSRNVPSGSQIPIMEDGSLGEMTGVDTDDRSEWHEFANGPEGPGGTGPDESRDAIGTDPPLDETEEILNEARETLDSEGPKISEPAPSEEQGGDEYDYNPGQY